jgi:hypothetical protein
MTTRNYLIASTCAPGATIVNAAISYIRAGFRPTPLWPLAESSTPTSPVCSCRTGCLPLHVCDPSCLRHPRDPPGTVHSGAGKHPRTMSWQESSFSEEDVRRVFRSSDGVGLVMGPCDLGDLLALDVDGELGRATLRDLVEQHGRPPTTLTAQTGSGGIHLVYRVRPPVDQMGRSSSAILNRGFAQGPRWTLRGIDLRAAGGQIAVAPTVHWSGVKYRWTRPMLPADLPEAWYRLLVEMTNR